MTSEGIGSMHGSAYDWAARANHRAGALEGTAMNGRISLLLVAFLSALAYTLWVVVTVGYVEFFRLTFANPAVIQVHMDLLLLLLVAIVWMRHDARANDRPFAPYLIATLLLGTTGILGYLLHREVAAQRAGAARALPA